MGKNEEHPLVVAVKEENLDEVQRIIRECPSWQIHDKVLEDASLLAFRSDTNVGTLIGIEIGEEQRRRNNSEGSGDLG